MAARGRGSKVPFCGTEESPKGNFGPGVPPNFAGTAQQSKARPQNSLPALSPLLGSD